MSMKSLANTEFWEKNFYSCNKTENEKCWDDSVYANKKIHSILNKYLPKGDKYKVLEIGCYPGSKLIFLKKKFGYSIYGVEINKQFVKETKANLKRFNIKGKIIHSDFFSRSFLKKNRLKFNILLDYGFIEHFENFEKIINNYSSLLKKKGYLIIIIPNFSGLYKFFVSKKLLKAHNLKIMNKDFFEKEISRRFNKLFCNYVGGVYTDSSKESNVNLILNNRGISKILVLAFNFFNKIMNFVPVIESKLLSPHLMYIGMKK